MRKAEVRWKKHSSCAASSWVNGDQPEYIAARSVLFRTSSMMLGVFLLLGLFPFEANAIAATPGVTAQKGNFSDHDATTAETQPPINDKEILDKKRDGAIPDGVPTNPNANPNTNGNDPPYEKVNKLSEEKSKPNISLSTNNTTTEPTASQMATMVLQSETFGRSYSVQAANVAATYGVSFNSSVTIYEAVMNNQDGLVQVKVTNTGSITWPKNGSIRLSYHMYDSAGLVTWDGPRVAMPSDIKPGGSVSLKIALWKHPPGNVVYTFDMVNENVTWFSAKGASTASLTYSISKYTPVFDSMTPLDGAAVTTNTPTLTVKAHDPDAFPGSIYYLFQVCDKSNFTGNCYSQGWTTDKTFTLPSLYWGRTYYWRARIGDTTTDTAWTAKSVFVPKVTQPSSAQYGNDPTGVFVEGVNPRSGNLTLSATDFSLGGLAPSVDVTRSYNSLDTRNNLFGQGWSSIFDLKITSESSVLNLITHPDGRQERFGKNPDGSWVSTNSSYSFSGTDFTAADGTRYGTLSTTNGSSLRQITTPQGGTMWITTSTDNAQWTSWHMNIVNGSFRNNGVGYGVSSVSLDVLNGHVTAMHVDDGSGVIKNWTYTYSGNLLAKVCTPKPAPNNCTSYTYVTASGGPRLSTITLPKGNQPFKATYNTDGTIATRSNSYGTWKFTRDTTPTASASTFVATDPNNHATKFSFDRTSNRLVQKVLPGLGVRSFYYDALGYLSKVVDENGNPVTLLNDEHGNVLTRCDNDAGGNHCEFFSYFWGDIGDPRNGKVTGQVTQRGADINDIAYKTTFEYDALGNVVKKHTPPTRDFPEGRDTTFNYSNGTQTEPWSSTPIPKGLLLSSSGQDSNGDVLAYDWEGRLRKVTNPVTGKHVEYEYDRVGHLTKLHEWKTIAGATPETTTVRELVTVSTYNEMGQALTETAPATTNVVTGEKHQLQTVNEYDTNGNLVSSTQKDVIGSDGTRKTQYEYDLNDRQVKVTDSLGRVTSKTYDAVDNVTREQDALGVEKSMTYTADDDLAMTKLVGFVDDPIAGTSPRDLILESRSYDPGGRLASVTDANGSITQYTYYGGSKARDVIAKDVIAADGSKHDVVTEHWNLDAAGSVYGYHRGNDQMIDVFDRDGSNAIYHSWIYNLGTEHSIDNYYDVHGNVVRKSDRNSGKDVVANVYDDAGQLISSMQSAGSQNLTTTYKYDESGHQTDVVSPRGNLTGANSAAFTSNSEWDENGNVVRQIAPSQTFTKSDGTLATGRPTTTFGYNTFGEVTHQKSPNGNVLRIEYDAAGRKVKQFLPTYVQPTGPTLNPVSSVVYDANDQVVSSTDFRGLVNTFDYDKLGRQIRSTEPKVTGQPASGFRRSYYDFVGNLTKSVDEVGATQEASYDSLGRVLTQTQVERVPSSTRLTTSMTYDDFGNLLSVTDPSGNKQTSTYNKAQEQISFSNALQKTTNLSRDSLGRVVQVVDPLGRQTKHMLDNAGRETSTQSLDRNGVLMSATNFGYDADGNQVTKTSPVGTSSTYSFDANNNLIQSVQPLTSTSSSATQYGYDLEGNLMSLKDANQRITSYTYNNWGLPETTVEPATAAFPNIADRKWTATYDADSNLINLAEPGGVTRTRSYDELNRLIGESGSGAEAPTGVRAFAYDLSGRLTSESAPGGSQTFTYNDRDLLTSSSGPTGAFLAVYDASGRITTRGDASGISTFSYDAANQVSQFDNSASSERIQYQYDVAGQLVQSSNAKQATPSNPYSVRTFGYDDMGRLTNDTLKINGATSLANAYTYDASSNVVTKNVTPATGLGAGQTSYSYDLAGRLASWKDPTGVTKSYVYDPVGNLLSNGTSAFSVDERNRVTSSNKAGIATTYKFTARGTQLTSTKAGVATRSLQYDAFDQLVNVGGTAYTYDALGRPIQTGNKLQYSGFARDPNKIGTDTIVQGVDYKPVAQVIAGATPSVQDISQNAHGDVSALFDSTGIVGQGLYSPQGEVVQTSGKTTALGFQGDYTDTKSSLVQMDARWYDSSTGSFTSRDDVASQVEDRNAINRYGYADADPVNNSDPTGHGAEVLAPLAAACAGSLGWVCVAVGVTTAIGAAGYAIKNASHNSNAGAKVKAIGGLGAYGAQKVWHALPGVSEASRTNPIMVSIAMQMVQNPAFLRAPGQAMRWLQSRINASAGTINRYLSALQNMDRKTVQCIANSCPSAGTRPIPGPPVISTEDRLAQAAAALLSRVDPKVGTVKQIKFKNAKVKTAKSTDPGQKPIPPEALILQANQIVKSLQDRSKDDDDDDYLTFYHGTSTESAASIRQNGVRSSEGGDFGRGFYVSDSRSQANALARGFDSPEVLEFRMKRSEFEELTHVDLGTGSIWEDYVRNNRIGYAFQYNVDVVSGPILGNLEFINGDRKRLYKTHGRVVTQYNFQTSKAQALLNKSVVQ